MRICVCVSGQVRSDMDSLKKLPAMLAGHDVTYVVKVWDKRGAPPRLEAWRQRTNLPELVGFLAGPTATANGLMPEVYDAVVSSLPTGEAELPVTESCFDFLPREHRHIEIRSENEFRADILPYRHRVQNNVRMWYLIDRADAKRRHLAQDFDMVVRMRPDTLLPDNIDRILEQIADDVAQGFVYSDTILPSIIGDQVFIARPDRMTLFTRYYRDFRYPQYCANIFCLPHQDLHQYCQKMEIPCREIPVIDKKTATRIRLTAISLEPFVRLPRVMDLIGAVRNPTPAFDTLRTLLELHIAVLDDPDTTTSDLHNTMAKLEGDPFAPEMRFAVSWMKYQVAHRLNEKSVALLHLCESHDAVHENGGEKLFMQIVEREGARFLADELLTPPTLLAQMPATTYRALGSMYLEAPKLHDALAMLQASAASGERGVVLLEKLAYVHSRLTQWHDVLNVVEVAAQSGLTTPLLHRLRARATDASNLKEIRPT